MADSLQKWVGRNRAPRVQITYDVEVGDAVEKRELPMVVGILADLSGHVVKPLPKLKDRRMTQVDRDNFDDVMSKIKPRLQLSVPNKITGEGDVDVEINFSKMSDFHPDGLAQNIPRLAKLLESRQQLRDLLAKLDGNDDLGALLNSVITNTDDLKKVKEQAQAGEDGEAAPVTPDA